MALEGVDYATGRLTADKAREQGLSFLCRYVSSPGSWKNLTQDEVDDWSQAGLGLVVVFERTADGALRGVDQGRQDAASAQAQLEQLGIGTAPLYFAVDLDVTDAQLPAVAAYLGGAREVVGDGRLGVYGSYAVVKQALDDGLVDYAWQTRAWSHGLQDPRAHLYQYENNVVVGDVTADRDRTVVSDTDYGQVQRPAPPTPTAPTVSELWPASGPVGTVVTITGTGLGSVTDVGFGDTNASQMHVEADTQITATAPQGIGTVDVVLVTADRTVVPAASFSYEDAAAGDMKDGGTDGRATDGTAGINAPAVDLSRP